MGTLLQFSGEGRAPIRGPRAGRDSGCEIIIFPGVRIERHDVDLDHRLADTAGSDRFESLGGDGRPRRSS